MILLGFIMSLVYMQAVHGWLSAYERLVNSQNFFSPYLTQEDFSRLGRNFVETGQYLEQVFPLFGVRFIAINDNYDSLNRQSRDGMLVPIKSMINFVPAFLQETPDLSQHTTFRIDHHIRGMSL